MKLREAFVSQTAYLIDNDGKIQFKGKWHEDYYKINFGINPGDHSAIDKVETKLYKRGWVRVRSQSGEINVQHSKNVSDKALKKTIEEIFNSKHAREVYISLVDDNNKNIKEESYKIDEFLSSDIVKRYLK